MYHVYISRSIKYPKQTYIGFTQDVDSRLQKHNEGGCPHTSKYKPWELLFYSSFKEKKKALDFEKYLKSHSGKAFSQKRLI